MQFIAHEGSGTLNTILPVVYKLCVNFIWHPLHATTMRKKGTRTSLRLWIKMKAWFFSPSLSVPGIMGCLTESQHKPISGKRLKILVYFDHDCLKNKSGHFVCFYVVTACAKSITFPVKHLQNAESVRELFTLAYCKSQAFGRPWPNEWLDYSYLLPIN